MKFGFVHQRNTIPSSGSKKLQGPPAQVHKRIISLKLNCICASDHERPMANRVADLGACGLVSTTSGLSLSLTSRAQFCVSTRDLSETTLDALISGSADNAIVCMPAALDIRLILEVVDQCVPVKAGILIRLLVTKLERAQLWHQLGFDRPSTETSDSPDVANGYATLQLKRQERSTDESLQRVHSLRTGTSVSALMLPAKVQEVVLKRVELSFRLAQEFCTKRRKLLKSFSMPTACHNQYLQTQSPAPILRDVQSHSCRSPGDPHQEPEGGATGQQPLAHNLDAEAGENGIEPLQSRQSLQSSRPDAPQAIDAELITRGSRRHTGWATATTRAATSVEIIGTPDTQSKNVFPPSLKRSLSSVLPDYRALLSTSIDEALELTEAGFAYAIAPPARGLPKGIRVSSKESFKHLSDVAPTIFRPGCAETFPDRSALLPTLAHALSQVGGPRARSKVLQMKVSQLTRDSESRSIHEEGSSSKDGRTAREASLLAHLWQLTQRGVLHEKKSAALAPVSQALEEWNCPWLDDMVSTAGSDPFDIAFDNSSDIALEDDLPAMLRDVPSPGDDLEILNDSSSSEPDLDRVDDEYDDDEYSQTDFSEMLEVIANTHDDSCSAQETDVGARDAGFACEDRFFGSDREELLELELEPLLNDGSDDMLGI